MSFGIVNYRKSKVIKYWLGVVSKNHVDRGVAGGFAQVCHGKEAPLKRLKKGDGFVYYSPGEQMGESNLKAFTAIGVVSHDTVYSFKMSENFIPYRRDIKYFKAQILPVQKIKDQLELTQNKNWGYQLRLGLVELSEHDYILLKKNMVMS